MEKIKCILCDENRAEVVIEENGFKGRKCYKCGLIYISPRPSLSEIVNLYAHDEAVVSSESQIRSSFIKRINAQYRLRILKKFIRKGELLEIGAGAGYFLEEARKNGFDVYGLELNPILGRFIRNNLGIPCEESPLSESPFDKKKFDIIFHSDVTSHFYDPISEFKTMNGRLREKGILMFETGNLGDIKKKYYKYFNKFQYPDHLFFFGEGSLRDLLQKAGFFLKKINRYSILPHLIILKIEKLIRDFINHRRRYENINRTNAKEMSHNRPNTSYLKKLIRDIHNYFLFIVCYKVGFLAPKKERPQTVIVVAQKKA